MTHLLDSSAFLAFFFGEPGRDRVTELLANPKLCVGISAVSIPEIWTRLKAEGRESAFDAEWAQHLPLFDVVAVVDDTVARRAVEMKRVARDRLPTVDSLIAATAAVHDAVLVHRDAHFARIPAKWLKQEMLDDR